jgi:hypothetical protein
MIKSNIKQNSLSISQKSGINVRKKNPAFKFLCLITACLISFSCNSKTPDLPKEILGLHIGMPKNEAQKILRQIAVFDRDEQKNQQVWRLKDDPRFGYLAVGYDQEDRIRYISAFVNKSTVKEKVSFQEIGDLNKAKKEIIKPHYRYIWDVPARDDRPAYQVIAYGDNPDFLTILSLNSSSSTASKEED